MRVKVGDTWYSPEKDVPIMVHLEEHDKRHIGDMPKEATHYAAFSDLDETSQEEKLEWMEKGSKHFKSFGLNPITRWQLVEVSTTDKEE